MGYIIALAGKGGTGKTTIAACLVRIIKEDKGGSLLAVDADPNSNLAEFLGIKMQKSIGEILDEVTNSLDAIPSGMTKDRFIEYKAQEAISEADGFDVLTMGRPEGPGCYCYVNNVLRSIVQKLIKDYDYIVIDNEAGLEHLSRRTTRKADCLLVVSDSTPAGIRAAKRIIALSKELKLEIAKEFLIFNRCHDITLEEMDKKKILGCLPEDKQIFQISQNGSSLMTLDKESAFLKRLRQIVQNIW